MLEALQRLGCTGNDAVSAWVEQIYADNFLNTRGIRQPARSKGRYKNNPSGFCQRYYLMLLPCFVFQEGILWVPEAISHTRSSAATTREWEGRRRGGSCPSTDVSIFVYLFFSGEKRKASTETMCISTYFGCTFAAQHQSSTAPCVSGLCSVRLSMA